MRGAEAEVAAGQSGARLHAARRYAKGPGRVQAGTIPARIGRGHAEVAQEEIFCEALVRVGRRAVVQAVVVVIKDPLHRKARRGRTEVGISQEI